MPRVRPAIRRPTPHDTLFRHVFGNPLRAAELLRHHLPRRTSRHLDWASLRPVPRSFVDEELRNRCADLVFTVRVAGRPTLVIILIEHKSAPDRLTVFQVARYVVRLHERWLDERPRARTLPAVLPFVLFHGAAPFRGPRRLRDLIDLPLPLRRWRGALPDFSFELMDLCVIGARLEQSTLATASKLSLLHLQNVREQRQTSRLLRRWAPLYRDLGASPGGLALVRRLVSYVATVSRDDRRNLRTAYHDIDSTTERTYMTVADRLIREGKREGKREGEREGRSRVLCIVLEARFGKLPASSRAKVAAATSAELDRWARAAVTAGSLDEVLA
jgi:predicted transposase/invertase (TIGR01784 family)